jgi:TonB family protein
MGYQALLFCPDERTARTVTQVLSELDFAVMTCAEPFAVVKKLMGERFDAVVVDCDNEQNATLIFKSARNAANNASSLAVAVVEGQAGVAKAFRMGANLVLTKPINVEQAKGTLRVARGLLRKGEAAKAATAAGNKPAPGAPESSRTAVSSVAASRPNTPVRPPASVTPLPQMAPPARGASASAKSGSDAESFLAESDEYTSPAAAEAESHAPAGKMASSNPEPAASPSNFGFAPKPSASAAASAAAPAREAMSPLPVVEKPVAIARPVEPTAENADVDDFTEDTAAPVAPIGDKRVREKKPAKAGSGRTRLVLGAAVMVLAAAVYLVSTQTGGAIALPGWLDAPVKIIKAALGKSAPATPSTPGPATPAPTSIQPMAPNPLPVAGPDSAKPSSAIPMPGMSVEQGAQTHPSPMSAGIKSPGSAGSTPMAGRSAAAGDSRPIIIKHTAAGDAMANAAPPLSVAAVAPANGVALPDLAAGAPPAPVLQSLGVSQGVSQGLVLKRVQPKYPASALEMRIEGSVDLLATIGKSGNISGLKILKGDAQLARAAADAVKQWKYKPYLLNGEPVEIQTQITVDFKLPR